MDTMDRQLRYFLCIAECGSLSRAAEVLDQTQSGLSKQLAMLESNIGQSLFMRTGRGLSLTAAGASLYETTCPAYRDIDRAVDHIRQQGVTHGTVRLATVHTLSYYFMADVVARFVSTHPEVNLSLLGRSSPDVVALVERGKADMGLVYDSAVDSGALTSIPLFDDDMALIVPMNHQWDGAQDLTSMPLRLVGFPPEYALRRMLHSARLEIEVVTEVETIDAMLKLVSAGVGYCILPSRIPEKLLADYRLRKLPIARPLLRRKVVLVMRAEKPVGRLVAQLQQCAAEVARGLDEG